MPVAYPSYKPPFLFRNGHVHTIFSYLKRNSAPLNFSRVLLDTADGDFLALDLLNGTRSGCAILVHGLEGSSESSYITSLALKLNTDGWNIACLNLRGCSGTDNNLYSAYHSGIIKDLDQVADYLSSYKTISLIGFSLGGNIVLKYVGHLGRYNLTKISAAAAVSVPCHLSSSSDKLETCQNFIYSRRFITALKTKLKRKIKAFPGNLTGRDLDNIKTIRQFDDLYTGPANGFADAEDYYTQNSSLYSLKDIRIPTLLINAKDDPFLTESCMPFKEAEENPMLHFYAPDYGGHVGFLPEKKGKPGMHETWITDFLNTHISS